MRQSLLFRVCVCVCVSEEKERHKQEERNPDREYVCMMHVGVCESVCMLIKTERKRRAKKKKKKAWERESSAPISKDLLMRK